MKLSKINKDQAAKILKAALYVGASAALSKLIADVTDHPDMFGSLTPIVNITLVTVKQFFTKAE